jgi:deoxyribodipyrimidine photo-lyase
VYTSLPTHYQEITQLLEQIDPVRYSKSRNFIDGAVTQLSPYVSRGVIDGKQILTHLIDKGYSYNACEKFVQQLFWREYFQRVWQTYQNEINQDIKQPQTEINNHGIPTALSNANTSIEAIDKAILLLKSSGMMHNHLRMYTAFLACNLGKSHWLHPAKWMYYHLLDGDWGSNALSWQWVAGSFSNKKYIANQENINHYTNSNQKNTFLDCSYDELQSLDTPSILKETEKLSIVTQLPAAIELTIVSDLPVLLYNYYNLSPTWRAGMNANKILLLEPEIFHEYPVSEKCISFMLQLAKNIEGIQIFVGSFTALKKKLNDQPVYFREHPLNIHYQGIEDQRPWVIPSTTEVRSSFFSFWKKNEQAIRRMFR